VGEEWWNKGAMVGNGECDDSGMRMVFRLTVYGLQEEATGGSLFMVKAQS
jgi:hypothetical protein